MLSSLHQRRTSAASICRTLTPLEQMVLASIGDVADEEAATRGLKNRMGLSNLKPTAKPGKSAPVSREKFGADTLDANGPQGGGTP
jgi:hypothetical protein